MLQPRWSAAALVAASLVVAGCGARLDERVRAQAADVALGDGTRTVGGGASDAAGADAGAAADGGSGTTSTGGASGDAATGGDGPRAQAGGGTAAGPGGPAQAGSGDRSAPAPAGGNGGATDIGVTATTITIGNVSDLSGPIPGLFSGATYGVDAYFSYINSQGGVFGRQLRMQVADSQTDCGSNKNAHANLVPKVLAFVGSFSVYDGCNVPLLDSKPGTIDLSYALSFQKKRSRSSYAVQPAPPGYPTGMFEYWKKKYGSKTKKVGSLCGNIPATLESQRMIKNAAESVGWEWVYDGTHPATQSRFDAEMLQMQRAGVELVFIVCNTTANAVAMKKQADSQGFKPQFVIPIGYASDFLERMGDAAQAEGIVGHNLYSLFFNKDEAAAIPELATYQQWMERTHAGVPLDLFSMYAWASAKLLVDALKKAGPKATRASLLAAVKAIGTFDAGGVITPGRPGAKEPSTCYILWEIKSGKYVRQDTPRGKYRCDGRFVPFNG